MRFLLAICLYLIIFGCRDNKTETSSYYFPVQELTEGKFYIYESPDSRFEPQYWYIRSHGLDSTTLLTIQILNTNLEVEVSAVEEITASGSVMQRLTLVETDSQGNTAHTQASIIEPSVFPFQVTDSLGMFLYHVNWKNDGRKTTVIRNRRYYGLEECEYQGESVSCARFRARELLGTEEEGSQELEYDVWEKYAEGIGLIWFRKEISEELEMEYKLKEILSMGDFETKYRTKKMLTIEPQ